MQPLSQIDREAWRFINSVAIITVAVDGVVNAMSAEWCAPVSLKPPLIGVFVGEERFTRPLIERADTFGVSLIAEDQAWIGRVCGRHSGREVNKIAEFGIPTEPAIYIEAPLIAGAAAQFECRVLDRRVYGSHLLVVGEPLRAVGNPDKQAIAYSRGRFYRLGEPICL
ncbi:MAG: flavin reductase family protein [Fimbriimonadales bacterium]|nr:flavin reductase family protein [Fimbriimonadales bacterium]MCS7190410.1 flavin reductase family protein [Fimbriimonadales bacterium]